MKLVDKTKLRNSYCWRSSGDTTANMSLWYADDFKLRALGRQWIQEGAFSGLLLVVWRQILQKGVNCLNPLPENLTNQGTSAYRRRDLQVIPHPDRFLSQPVLQKAYSSFPGITYSLLLCPPPPICFPKERYMSFQISLGLGYIHSSFTWCPHAHGYLYSC